MIINEYKVTAYFGDEKVWEYYIDESASNELLLTLYTFYKYSEAGYKIEEYVSGEKLVVSKLDKEGELRTRQYTNERVATIGYEDSIKTSSV